MQKALYFPPTDGIQNRGGGWARGRVVKIDPRGSPVLGFGEVRKVIVGETKIVASEIGVNPK